MKVFELPTISGAERLYATLFSITELSEIPSDVDETMEKALETLPEISRKMIRMHFWDGKTISDISSETGINVARVKSGIERSVRRLRGKASGSYIRYGEKYYSAEKYKRLQDEIAFEEHEIAKMEAVLERLKDKKDKLKEEIRKELEIKSFEEAEEILDSDRMPVTELGVSKRTLNALHFRRVETVGDLRKLSKKDLDHIYGLGKKGLAELKSSVEEKTGVPLDFS